jgi:3'-5' exoribonuclease
VDDAEIRELIKIAPAAKTIHHAYRSGLLEHIVSITKTLDFMSKLHAPYLNRDLLFLGGILHDIGKIWELTYDRTTDYSLEGRLIGHLVMGVELVEKKVTLLNQSEAFKNNPVSDERKAIIKHLVVAHHGRLEYGSPKVPQTLEAQVVHSIDDLDSKINEIKGFILQDQNPGQWTLLHKNHQRYYFKPDWSNQKPS